MMLPFLLAATVALAPVAPRAVDLGPAKFYAQNDEGAQLVGLKLVVSAGTARQTAAQNGLAALTAQTILLSKIDGVTLADRIVAAGGASSFEVDASVTRFSIEALPGALPGIAADLARVLASPDVSRDTVNAARQMLGSHIDDDQKNPVAVGVEMLHQSYYQGSAGAPSLGTPASLINLGPSDVTAFIAAHYRRGNAFAIGVGRVDDAANAAARTIVAALPDGSELPAVITARAIAAVPKEMITHREIGVPFILVGFAAPALSDADFGGMLVLRALFNDIAARESSTTLSPFERGIDTVYDYDIKPAAFTVAINGSQLDPTAGLKVIEAIVKTASAKRLAADVVKKYQETARGDWALEASTLTERGWLIGAAVNEGADPATAQHVVAAIDSVTPATLQRLAKLYLARYAVAVVLPRTEN